MGVPLYPPDFGSLVDGLRRGIRQAQTQAQSRLPFQTIKTSILTLLGSFVVQGSGAIDVKDANGTTLATIGRIGFSGTGAPVTGITVYRPNGSRALTSYNTPDGSLDFNAIWDRSGHIVASDDGVSGQGNATPWVPIPQPVSNLYALMPAHDGALWAPVAFSTAYATHPRLRVNLTAYADPGVAGEVKVVVNGQDVFAGVAVPSGGSVAHDATYPMPGWPDLLDYCAQIEVEVQVRVTSGTGKVYVLTRGMYQVQS